MKRLDDEQRESLAYAAAEAYKGAERGVTKFDLARSLSEAEGFDYDHALLAIDAIDAWVDLYADAEGQS